MFYLRIVFFTLFLLIIYIPCKSQYYSVAWYNTENGLPQNSVKDIVCDAYGFIWLSTEIGLSKYDGQNFTSFTEGIINKRLGNFTGTIRSDSIFITNENENELLLIHKGQVSLSPIKSIFHKNFRKKEYFLIAKNSFTEDIAKNTEHFLHSEHGIYFFDKNMQYLAKSDPKEIAVIPYSLDYTEKNTFFGIGNRIYFRNRNLSKMYELKDGRQSIKPGDKRFLDKNVRFFWNKMNNQSFLLIKNTLYKIYENNGLLSLKKIFESKDPEVLDNATSIFYDENYKKLYIGNLIKGLCVISLYDFNVIQNSSSSASNVFYSLLPYDKNSILSPDGTLFSSDAKKIRSGLLKGKSDKYSFIKDDNHFLYKNKNELFVAPIKNLNAVKTINFPKYIASIFYENKFYMISFEGKNGILKLCRDPYFTKTERTYITKEEVKFVKFFTKDSLLIGTRGSLYKASVKNSDLMKIRNTNFIDVRNIFIDSDHTIWILTYGNGIYFLKDNALKKIPNDPENYLNFSHCILEDKLGFFWISTNNGLFKIKKSLLLGNRTDVSKLYYFYNDNNGFVTSEFNGGCNPCGIKLENGLSALPSLQGIVTFDPLQIKSHYPKNIFIKKAIINNDESREINNSELLLERDFYRAEVLIDIPYFGSPKNLKIEAKISKKNNDWEDIGETRTFTFTNLAGGDYDLLVRTLVSDKGKYKYQRIKIKVKPYFYETFLFKTFTLFLFLLFGALGYLLRISYLKKNNEKLEGLVKARTVELNTTLHVLQQTKSSLEREIVHQKKVIGSISHDITTPILYLSLTLQNISNSEDDEITVKKDYLQSLYYSTNELYHFTQALKEYADINDEKKSFEFKKYPLNEIILKKIKLFQNISSEKGNTIINTIDDGILINFGKNVFAVIIHNLLDNAIKHTENGKIIFSYLEENQRKIIRITDEGEGISDEMITYYHTLQDIDHEEKFTLQNYGLGLHLIIQLLQMMQLKLKITKNHPHGTIVNIIYK